ncbi:hypothetical protein UF75_4256 [Desulfosporosinus sp. I2]|nr:hypothetical protein UF75_4256 [Desulfosporosinus sp. I2]
MLRFSMNKEAKVAEDQILSHFCLFKKLYYEFSSCPTLLNVAV